MKNTTRFADVDITLTPRGSIRLPSLAKALRDPAFARRVRCTIDRTFDGMIDGMRDVDGDNTVTAESIAEELTKKGAKAHHGAGAYLDRNGYQIAVYTYCDHWTITLRDEEIRRLEDVIAIVGAWEIDYAVTTPGGHVKPSAKALATEEVRRMSRCLDGLAFDDAVSKMRGTSDPLLAIARVDNRFASWSPVSSSSVSA